MSELSAETTLRRVEFPGSRIQNEMVFFDPEVGKYYATGPVGADIWEFLQTPRLVVVIFDHISATYDIDRTTCEAEVRAFLAQMLETGLVAVEA